MASRELPPRKKKSRQPAPTTILALGDDLLREVFLRLPSLPSLVRAALACPAFLRAVRSSPAFRRRFRELHSPPILGAFLVNDEPAMPAFVPIRLRGRRSDPDLDAALRGLDVFLTRLPDATGAKEDDGEDAEEENDAEDEDDAICISLCRGWGSRPLFEKNDEDEDEDDVEDKDEDEDDVEDEDEDVEDKDEEEDSEEEFTAICDKKDEDDGPEWSMSGCRDGYIVLVTPQWNTKKVAVYDPLTGALHLFPAPPDEVFNGDSEDTEAEFHVIPSEADDRSFRLLSVCKENRGAVAVFSPDTREWQITPTAERLAYAGNGTLVNGSVYWANAEGEGDNIPVLNTATMQFSQIDLPAGRFDYVAGETNDGKLCLVRASDLNLNVWVRGADDDGDDEWVWDKTFRMDDAIHKLDLGITDECPGLNVAAIIGGVVYLSIHQDEPPNWFLSFCLETRQLKKLCPITRSEFCYPYIMAWPPSLVRSKVGAV